MNKQWLQAKLWAKNFKLTNIQSLEDCLSLTIRQLRALASRLAQKEPYVFTVKRFGKAVSRMKKEELAKAIWDVRKIALSCPKGQWEEEKITGRIAVASCDGQKWASCFGFDTEQEAYKFFQWLFAKRVCAQASIRKSKRTQSPIEVKVWGMVEKVFEVICSKDIQRAINGALESVFSEWTLSFEAAVGMGEYAYRVVNPRTLKTLGHVRYVSSTFSWQFCLSIFQGNEESGSLRWAVEKLIGYYNLAEQCLSS